MNVLTTMTQDATLRASQGCAACCAPAAAADVLSDLLGFCGHPRAALQFALARRLGTDPQQGTPFEKLLQLVSMLFVDVQVLLSPTIEQLEAGRAAGAQVLGLIAGDSIGHVVRFLGTEVELSRWRAFNNLSVLEQTRVARVFDPLRNLWPHALPEFLPAVEFERRLHRGGALLVRHVKDSRLLRAILADVQAQLH